MADVHTEHAPRVTKPRKADLVRLQKLVDSWNEEERNLQSHYGPAGSGSLRVSRMKDAAALASVLAHLTRESAAQARLTAALRELQGMSGIGPRALCVIRDALDAS